MSRMPWHLFQNRQPRAHLVVAALAEVSATDDGDELAVVQNVLKRLVSKQKPVGDFASTVVRDAGRPEVYFAFDDEADAKKFAAALETETTARRHRIASLSPAPTGPLCQSAQHRKQGIATFSLQLNEGVASGRLSRSTGRGA